METLREADVTVEDLRTVQPDLEDVFVDLTGVEGGVDTRNRDR
jgi:ABC-2 type transport system ATP-binding protein